MGKKSKQVVTDAQAAPAAQHPKPAQVPAATAAPEAPKEALKGDKKRAKSEIDDIFAIGKKAKQDAGSSKQQQEQEEEDEPAAPELQELAKKVKAARQQQAAAPAAPPAKVEGSKDDIFGAAGGKGRQRTTEGYAIYSEQELRLGAQGGDTDLCPFDCDCCF